MENKLWEAWELFKDNNCIALLAKLGSVKFLTQKFLKIWHAENIKFYVKNNVLKKVSAKNFDAVKFLKGEAPISYLSACVAANKQVEDDFLISVVKSAKKINELGCVVWCLGKLGKDTLLYNLLNELDFIEEKLPIEIWEPEFYGLA
ncbi:hypothetical protein [Shewanella woodyi]|uniref:hypothetical protein n=1 Tax=Shewanella woodyi TaxID=60961 RepID=UPI0007EBC11A|nr:hypothetical protein [Shewanella woodyi]